MSKRTLWVALLCCFVGVCVTCRGHSSQVIGDFRGGSPPDAARTQLRNRGFNSGWTENSKANPDDRSRPRHDFLEMKGPFSDLGVTGQLELTFFNDRLMDAQFIPSESERYFRLLSQLLGKLPENPGTPKRISAEVALTYYHDPDGSMRFYWDYLPLSKEWKDWVAKYSSVFSPQLILNS
jgi:hypothetical protein